MSQSLGAIMFQQQGNQQQKVMTIRFPSTSAFMIDSVDRAEEAMSSGDFTIVKPMSLNNGFFTRMALQEIVLDYGIPNITSYNKNDEFYITYDIGSGPVQETAAINPGWYTVEEALDAIVAALNTSIGPGTFGIVTGSGLVSMAMTNPAHTFEIELGGFIPNPDGTFPPNNLALELFNFSAINQGQNNSYFIVAPRLLPYRYLDFVCNQLTYNQKLKDNDTSEQPRDVLYRWYFAWDEETSYDGYGFPVLQGYRQFNQRRFLAFPKQIQWTPNMPVGNLNFQVFSDQDRIVDAEAVPDNEGGAEMEFRMTLLLSED